MTPVATGPWFRTREVAPGLVRIDEPHVHPLLQANVWWLRGRDRDLVVDTGLGVGCLPAEVPGLVASSPFVVLSHGHLDHSGGAADFDSVWAHPAEAVDEPRPGSLHTATLLEELGGPAVPGGSPDAELPALLIDATPYAGYDPAAYRLRPPRHVHPLADGDVVDLGDRRLTVLHLPGHTPGTICLLEEATGTLFSGDFVYDDTLLDELVGSSVDAYVASFERLRRLPVRVVHPGHGDSFDGARLRELTEAYLMHRGE